MTRIATRSRADTDTAIAEVEQQFACLSQRIRAHWKDSAHALHPELQPTGYRIVTALLTDGPTTATHLAEQLTTDKSVLSRQIVHLEALGLVERHTDERDGRARKLALTADGFARVTAVREANLAAFRQTLAEWPLDDLVTLGALLRRLAGGHDDTSRS